VALVAAILAMPLAAGCGDGGGDAGKAGTKKAVLAWDGAPVLRVSPSGARVLIGEVRNQSLGREKSKLKATELKVVDRRGRRVQASIGFISTFVRSLYPQNGRPGMSRDEFPEAEQRRIGYLAVLRSGEATPLTVSWRQSPGDPVASRIVYPAGSLAIPRTPR
jgi:hypothetical protein